MENSQIDLKCPACGETEFEFDDTKSDGEPATDQLVECVSCHKEVSYGDLIKANADVIDEHVQGIGEEFAKELTDDLAKNMKDAIKKFGLH